MKEPEQMFGMVEEEEAHTYKEAAEWKLSDLFANEEYRGKVDVFYDYDFGDGWDHIITFVGEEDVSLRKGMREPTYNNAFCFAGEPTDPTSNLGHPCAEDCGGQPGWEELKRLLKGDFDPDDRKGWYRNDCANGGPSLDPYKWDILKVNDKLRRVKKK
ncbi:hypothetical protein H2200_008221 [Cladophialophora chaetospira]|uniref:Plasmid pRiA4b Orf3-like domain-containing protein n=1 Tax=Cladophialophora chaetospira TaxID=386627 RepID=A0AA39CFX2_9EURO|nr:hypothetical protein H2200_008221 [Cladophialophora chaetospira]